MRIEFKALIVLVLILICISFVVKKCVALDVSLGYGHDVPVLSWQSEGLKCSVIQIKVSKEFKAPWYYSGVLDVLQGKVNPMIIDGKYFSGIYNGLAVSARLGIQQNLAGRFVTQGFGGFGVLPKHMPEIGNSGIVGHFGVGVKYVTTNWEIGYEWMHMSDPFQHGDKGWNIQFLTIRRRF